MRYLLDYLRQANICLPNKLVWALLAGHYGGQLIIIIVYLLDWMFNKGDRAELLLLLDKL